MPNGKIRRLIPLPEAPRGLRLNSPQKSVRGKIPPFEAFCSTFDWAVKMPLKGYRLGASPFHTQKRKDMSIELFIFVPCFKNLEKFSSTSAFYKNWGFLGSDCPFELFFFSLGRMGIYFPLGSVSADYWRLPQRARGRSYFLPGSGRHPPPFYGLS